MDDELPALGKKKKEAVEVVEEVEEEALGEGGFEDW